jgi:formate/nitrite transporter FocA (FNT family)
MEFIQTHIGNIIAGVIVLAALTFAVYRVINNIRKGKTGCGCGCSKCP